jgi:hypothetical protein
MKRFSRRDALSLAVLSSVPALPPTATDSADFELVGLGRRFDSIAAKLDFAIDRGFDIDWSDLKEFGRMVDEIVAMPAATIDGLCVKARVGCWGLLGDLDDPGEKATADKRITLSIIARAQDFASGSSRRIAMMADVSIIIPVVRDRRRACRHGRLNEMAPLGVRHSRAQSVTSVRQDQPHAHCERDQDVRERL